MTAYKDKEGKLRFDLVPPEMNLAFAEVATFGIVKLKNKGIKNPERNWETGLKLVEDHLAAANRHINKWELGINLDHESKLNHMKHALWHITAIVTQIERNRNDLDDRPSTKILLTTSALNLKDEERSWAVSDQGCTAIEQHLETMKTKKSQYFKGDDNE